MAFKELYSFTIEEEKEVEEEEVESEQAKYKAEEKVGVAQPMCE